MMNYHLKIVTPPVLEPVTAGLVQLYTHIDAGVEDPIIDMWIKAARGLAEAYQRRALITQTVEMSFDRFPEMPLYLPLAPLQSVISVKYFDYENTETTINSSEFIVDTDSAPGRICFAYGKMWPSIQLREMNSVKIRFVAGYGSLAFDEDDGVLVAGSVPESVVHAICVYCAFHNENRAAEIDSVPKQFYDLLAFDRMYT